MKNRITALLLLLPFVVVFGQTDALEWQLQHAVSKKWLPFGTKGSVQEVLIADGELPDPFIGMNENAFGWIEDHDWELRSEFQLTPAEMAKSHIDLELPNVDTYAKVYINDHYLGTTENTYLVYRFDIRKWAKAGNNRVKLVFQSPVSYQLPRMKDSGVTLPAPNDLGKVAVAPYCRKPQYQFGWDWSLRMVTIGLWNPASVKAYDDNRVTGKSVYTATLAEDFALMELQLLLRNPAKDSLVWESRLFGTSKVVAEGNILKRLERIDNPQLWWPRGHGSQYVYEDDWVLKTASGRIIGSGKQRFGVRRSELITVPDQWGTSYTIRVNGRDLFCKGADYIPQDIFPARVTDASLREAVRTMRDANFNMVRVWGGGYYQPEAFYDECDALGIMVWQDFMFACAMYPGTDAFLKNVKQEFDQQIPRIAAHPSVVIFNGNNEVDVAWKNWGFKDQYKLDDRQSVIIQQYYDRLFRELLPKTVSSWTNVPYIHTSPLSNWGKDEFFNHGTMHYWGVWHGKDPIEDFGRKTGRFNAEYGFQSFPEYSTLLKFSTPDQWKLDDVVMKHHQKSYVGNGMIEKHATILYGKTDDFKRFVYYSQLTQATAVSMAISSHRTNMPRCSGTIYWQMNDCWPAPTWSSIDYYGNWKALQYLVRDDYADVAVVAKIDTLGTEKYFLVSDVPEGFACKIHCAVYALDGKQLASWDCNQAVNGFHSSELFRSELRGHRSDNFQVRFSWNDATGRSYSRSFMHLPAAAKSADPKDVDWSITEIDTTAKTAVIVVRNKQFVRQLWVSSNNQGVRFDRNFLDLLPGEHTIRIRYDVLPKKEEFELLWL